MMTFLHSLVIVAAKVEYDYHDPEALVHYQPLNLDEYEIVSRFVIANHLSVKQRLDYWQLMI